MAYKLIDETYCPYVGEKRKEFICDTDADFAKLPKCCTGSTAVSIESGKVYVVSTFGNWIPFGEGYVEKEPVGSIIGTWQFNSTLTSGCPADVKINFTTNNNLMYYDYTAGEDVTAETNSFMAMHTPYATTLYFYVNYEQRTSAAAFSPSGFSNNFDGVIHITGGDDVENETFVTWLTENATKVG